LVENGSTIISKSNYDLSSITFGEVGVEYLNLDPILKVSDNIDSKFGLMLITILREV
jgi:nucleoside recognition membrane protein YjiH